MKVGNRAARAGKSPQVFRYITNMTVDVPKWSNLDIERAEVQRLARIERAPNAAALGMPTGMHNRLRGSLSQQPGSSAPRIPGTGQEPER